MSQDAVPVVALLDVIPSRQRLVLAMSNILKRHVLTVDDLPLCHSFHVKTVLYTVVIVTNRIVLSAVPTAIVVFFINTATTEISPLSLHDDLPAGEVAG